MSILDSIGDIIESATRVVVLSIVLIFAIAIAIMILKVV